MVFNKINTKNKVIKTGRISETTRICVNNMIAAFFFFLYITNVMIKQNLTATRKINEEKISVVDGF